MKKAIFIALLAFFSVHTLGQNNTDVKDPKAKKILDQVSAKTKSYKNITAKFTYSLDNKDEDMHDSQDGEIIMKGDKYNLKMAGQEIIYDGEFVWIILREEKEANKGLPDKDGLNPSDMFNVYKDGWKYKYIKQTTMDGVTIEIVDLVPKDGDKSFSRVRLNIDKAKSHIKSAIFYGKDGTYYTYTLKEIKVNIELNDNVFEFTPTKDWLITDLTED